MPKIIIRLSVFALAISIALFSLLAAADETPPGDPFGGSGSTPPQNTTPPPPFQNNTIPQNNTPAPTYITYDSTLKVNEVKAEVDRKESTISSSGEKIPKEAKEESNVEFNIQVKNTFDSEIRNIKVTATIEKIDDGDDIEESSDRFNLASGETKTVKLEFKLPLRVDDGSYDVKIDAEGRDAGNNIHKLSWELKLGVNKDRHKLKILKASITPSTISCSRNVNLEIDVLNLGSEEEDKAAIGLKNSFLGLNFKQGKIELGEGTDDNAEYSKTFVLDIPSSAASGLYTIKVNAYYDEDKLATSKDASLMVEGCKQQKGKSSSLKALPPGVKETLEASSKTKGNSNISYTYEGPLILLLVVVLIILVGLIVFLVGVAIIRFRK